MHFELARALTPEQALAQTYALVASLFGFDDVSVDAGQFEYSADTGTVELAAPKPPAPAEDLLRLGDDPVGKAGNGKTAIDNAYAGSHPDIPVEQDQSPIMQAARAIADAEGMTGDKREQFLQTIQDKRDLFTLATIDGETKIVMADGKEGGYNAKTFTIDKLPADSRDVMTTTFTYTDENGVRREETIFIFNDCSNPAIDASEDKVVPPPVVEPPCVETPDPVQHELVGEKPGEVVKVAVITRDGIEPGQLYQDDGDGRIYEIKNGKLCLDGNDNFIGLPTEEERAKDLAAYEAKYADQEGYERPEYLVYKLVDCDGNSIVVCWNVEKQSWGVFFDRTWHPIGEAGIDGPVIDSKEELEAYLKANDVANAKK